ncbi:MAG: hypothetical protein PWP23_2332 [Candidatus Sumerlaeota bacterium]|nr:hypothetical protein [Candidatus Sumerlaeota bacterium]
MALGKRKAAHQPEAELAPPPPVIPWRVPPMGSLGDAWDEKIVLPEAPKAPRPPERKRKRRYQPGSFDVQFVEWQPPLHAAVIAAWAFLAMALLTTGPAYPLMPYVALLGLLFAMLGAFLLRTTHRDCSGEKSAWAAIAVGIVLIGVDTTEPTFGLYESHFTQTMAVPVSAMTLDDRIEQAKADMDLMARVTQCAFAVLDRGVTAEGRDSVNGRLPGDSVSFRISSLRDYDIRSKSELEQEYLYYTRDNLPRDLFSDAPEATYGVFVTDEYIIVYSPGPDREWQINPLAPVTDYVSDPTTELAKYRYVEGTGPQGPGDLIHVRPLRSPEETGYGGFVSGGALETDHCLTTKQELLDRGW